MVKGTGSPAGDTSAGSAAQVFDCASQEVCIAFVICTASNQKPCVPRAELSVAKRTSIWIGTPAKLDRSNDACRHVVAVPAQPWRLQRLSHSETPPHPVVVYGAPVGMRSVLTPVLTLMARTTARS